MQQLAGVIVGGELSIHGLTEATCGGWNRRELVQIEEIHE